MPKAPRVPKYRYPDGELVSDWITFAWIFAALAALVGLVWWVTA